MSVDTTVLVVKHLDDKYYVACVQAAENITMDNDAQSIEWHKQAAIRKGRVTQDVQEAFKFADDCEKEHEDFMGCTSEYGVKVYSLPKKVLNA